MRETIRVEKKHEALSLATGISFACEPAWYSGTMRDLKMDLIIPKCREGHKACPTIVWICGGAYMVVDRSIWMPQMIKFARAGYVIASIEYRTSNEAQFPAQLIDIKSAIRYLKANASRFCIDSDHIFVMGESAGGALASLAGVTGNIRDYDLGNNLEYDSSVCGVVDFYGPAIIQEDGCKTGGDVPDWTFRAYLGPNFGEKELERVNAINYVSDKTPPFFLLHGTDDPLVPLSGSANYYEELKKNGVDVDLLVVEGAGHGDALFFQDEIVERILEFLDKVCN